MTSSSSIILLAHGSRLESANREVVALALRLEEKLETKVLAAFLELASPSLPEALDLLLPGTAGPVLVLPYFLTQGRHLSEDIPRQIAEKSRAHPGISIRLLDYMGSHSRAVDLLAEIALPELKRG